MNVDDLIDKKFKWISPTTGGETFGEILKVYRYRNENETLIETREGNVYPISECFIEINGDYKKIELN